jgi:hypothetical protein
MQREPVEARTVDNCWEWGNKWRGVTASRQMEGGESLFTASLKSLEKLLVAQLVKGLAICYGYQSFIRLFTTGHC